MSNAAHLLRRRGIPIGILLLLVLVLPACSTAEDKTRAISLKRTYTLAEGQQRTGDQVIWANEVTLAVDSRIEGDATLVGDSVSLQGAITGDVVIVADTLVVGPAATIAGDISVCAQHFERSETAVLGGEFKEECAHSKRVSVANLIESGWEGWRHSWFFRLSSVVVGALFYGALAALATILFPETLNYMSASIRMAPLKTGGIGLLTMAVAVSLTVLYVMSLLLLFPVVLLPFVFTVWIALALFSVLGWVAMAEPFGKLILRHIGLADQPRMVAAMLGGILLALLLRVWSMFWFTAWVGLLISAVLIAFGLGAVLLTRAGTKPYVPKSADPVNNPAARLAK